MKANVLQLVDSFRQGGTERQAVQLTKLLRESGRFNVTVACLNGDGALRAEIERLGIGEIAEFPLNNFYDANFARQLRRLRALLREREIHVLHAHDFYTNIFGMFAGALARTPVRIASRREIGGLRTANQRRVERLAFRLAHAVIANAGAVKESLIAEGVKESKIEIIYNGLDDARLRVDSSIAREELLEAVGLPSVFASRRFVAIVANLRHRVKDHPTFLRAARRVKERVKDAAFVVAGEGELETELRALADEFGLKDDAFFIGRCARVAELLAVSEVCVLSSRSEGFSNSILEYMAAARPVVATAVGGTAEAVVEGETGFLVAPGDDERMAARIVELLNNAERARAMGERGRAVVTEKFSCAAQLARTEKLYDALLARRAKLAGAKASVERAIETRKSETA